MGEGEPHGGTHGSETNTGSGSDFHMEEFKALKAEIAELIKSSSANLPYALLASAGVYTWLLTTKCPTSADIPLFYKEEIVRAAWLIPLAVSSIFGVLSLLAYCRIGQMGTYLHKLESRFRQGRLGWEHYFARLGRMVLFGYAATWLFLIGINAVVACAMWSSAVCQHL